MPGGRFAPAGRALRGCPAGGSPVRPRTVQGRLGRPNYDPTLLQSPLPGMCERGHTLISRRFGAGCKNGGGAKPRSAHRARQLVPASGARLRPHARRRLRDLRGPAAGLRRARGGDRRPPAPGAALPAAARAGAARPGPPGVGRRSPLQHRLPRPPHRAAAPRRGPGSCAGSPAACSARRSIAVARCGSCGSSRGWPTSGFALLSKTHHALVDGVSGVDIATVLFDSSPNPMPVAPPEQEWVPRPVPTPAQLLGEALLERATVPAELAAGCARRSAGPRQMARRAAEAAAAVGSFGRAGLQPAPPSPFNVRIGPHRRFTWVRGDLAQFKAIKNALGGTVNDVVLAAVAGALGSFMRLHGEVTDGVVLRAMVPVSIRADVERGALGNRVAAMWAPLPVGIEDPVARLTDDHRGDGRHQGVRPGRRRSGAHPAVRASRRRRSWPRRRGCRPASGCSTWS